MKYYSKCLVAMFMTAGLALAGCGETADDTPGSDKKEGENASTAVDSSMASTTPAADADMVVTNVSLPNMHWT